jgi:hypothetical protein
LDAFNNGYLSIGHSHQGYYAIIPNVATYLATLVPLNQAPIVTTLIALLVQIIPFYLIFTSQSEFIDSSVKKILFSITILIVGAIAELWLNTITSQFHFIIILFLILIENKNKINSKNKVVFYLLVILSGLSGVPSNILAPLFLYSYMMTKNKMNLSIFYLLLITSLIQILFIFLSKSEGLNRFNYEAIFSFDYCKEIIMSTFQYPVLRTPKLGIHSISIIPLIYILIRYIRNKSYFILFFITSLWLAFIMITTSLNMAGGARYIYASSVIFMLGLIVSLFDKTLQKNIKYIIISYIAISFLYPSNLKMQKLTPENYH